MKDLYVKEISHKKKMKYLEFYYEYIISGEMPVAGLCDYFGSDALEIFIPTIEEFSRGRQMLRSHLYYWGATGEYKYGNNKILAGKFTPLRQTIVLFLAAMNNEL